MYLKIERRASSRVAHREWMMSFSSSVAKKLSATALSRQFPFRLMLATMPCAASTAWYSAHAY